MQDELSYEYVRVLKENHGALRLLSADTAPMVVSFLYMIFIEPNKRSIAYSDVESRLADYLFELREAHGEDKYPRTARTYLEEWAGSKGYLSKYYTMKSDEPELDITPDAETAIAWLRGLQAENFVGTESRLHTVINLLREMIRNSEEDPEKRIAELENQRQQIEREIEAIRSGHFELPDATRLKERFFQARDTARQLLGDFRQVEENFKRLDKITREKIAAAGATKGALLDEIFSEQDFIRDTDQGRSFHAFWEFLMSPTHQRELTDLIDKAYSLAAIESIKPDDFLKRIRFYLLEAGNKVYETQIRIVEQLRKFLDDQVFLENRRLMRVVQDIEKKALEIKNNIPNGSDFIRLNDFRPRINLVLSRGLFAVPDKSKLGKVQPVNGTTDLDPTILYEQMYVNEDILASNIRHALSQRTQISLAELTQLYPVQKGLAEILVYFKLASNRDTTTINQDTREEITWEHKGNVRMLNLPQVIFVR